MCRGSGLMAKCMGAVRMCSPIRTGLFVCVCVCVIHMRHVSFICVTWLIHIGCGSYVFANTNRFVCLCVCVCDSYYTWHKKWMRHDSFTSGADVWHDSFVFVTWLVHMCDMTHSYVRHDSITCATWLIHIGCGSWVFANKNRFVCICICVCV